VSDYHRLMTDVTAAPAPAYSPGLEGVIAGETSLSSVDGERGRLLYRGYRIGDLVARGTYPAVANLLWTGEWDAAHHLPTGPVPALVMDGRLLPTTTKPMDAPDRGLGLGCHQASCLAADDRRRPRADRVRPLRAGRLRPPARRPRAGRPGSEPRPRPGLPLSAERGTSRRGHGSRARRLLRRRGRPRLQRIDVRGAGRHPTRSTSRRL
jgi:hypothetical protein